MVGIFLILNMVEEIYIFNITVQRDFDNFCSDFIYMCGHKPNIAKSSFDLVMVLHEKLKGGELHYGSSGEEQICSKVV